MPAALFGKVDRVDRYFYLFLSRIIDAAASDLASILWRHNAGRIPLLAAIVAASYAIRLRPDIPNTHHIENDEKKRDEGGKERNQNMFLIHNWIGFKMFSNHKPGGDGSEPDGQEDKCEQNR